jgi:hypothetical protein
MSRITWPAEKWTGLAGFSVGVDVGSTGDGDADRVGSDVADAALEDVDAAWVGSGGLAEPSLQAVTTSSAAAARSSP